MNTQEFLIALDARVSQYDLLSHPFYQAWSAGELTVADLREYARDYYHQVKSFPTYLAELAVRLEDGELRDAVLANMTDEKGMEDQPGTAGTDHAELWLDFAEGMGSSRNLVQHNPAPEVTGLIDSFHRLAAEGSTAEALAAFYAYESQVPRIAEEKNRGLEKMYGASEKTRGYFTLHTTADVYHSQVWREQLAKQVAAKPETAEKALNAAESTAQLLWLVLDGMESRRAKAAA
jgi:pyrroloquinoline-quinone synthase